jgi:hypothetical protein
MNIKRKLRQEANVFVPDVLDKVLNRVGYMPTPKKPFWNLKTITLAGAAASLIIVAAVVIPYYRNVAVVANAETDVELSIMPASTYNQTGTIDEEDIPVFAYRFDKNLKTKQLNDDGTNAIYAKNDNAKIILAGVGPTNTVGKSADQITMSIVEKAALTGFIEVSGRGNFVTITTSGENVANRTAVEERVYDTVMEYFRARAIYGVLQVNGENSNIDFSGYDESHDNIDDFEDDFDSHCHDHQDDDDQRGPTWGDDYDEWMNEHDNHGNGPGSHGM